MAGAHTYAADFTPSISGVRSLGLNGRSETNLTIDVNGQPDLPISFPAEGGHGPPRLLFPESQCF